MWGQARFRTEWNDNEPADKRKPDGKEENEIQSDKGQTEKADLKC